MLLHALTQRTGQRRLLAFDQLRHYGARDPIIVLRMLDAIMQVATVARNPAYREVLGQYVEKIASAAERGIDDPYEIEAVRARVQAAQRAVSPPTLSQIPP